MDALPRDSIGWYGKLPTLGDFASRRLPAPFVECWDAWLAAGLAHWREADPEGWRDAYLDGPSWRFLLLPGALPGDYSTEVVAGVLMPSVDRVGRYFPLTLLWSLGAVPAGAEQASALLGRLRALEDLAVDAMQDDWTIDQFEAELTALVATPLAPPRDPLHDLPAPPGRHDGGMAALRLSGADLGSHLAHWARDALLAHWQGCALWLADGGESPQLRVSDGLPAEEDFIALFRGAQP